MLLHWIWNHLEASWNLHDHCAMGSRKTLFKQGGWSRSPHWWSLPTLTLLWLYPVDKEAKLQMGELARWSTAIVADSLPKVVEESTVSSCVLWALSNQCKVYAKIIPDYIFKGLQKGPQNEYLAKWWGWVSVCKGNCKQKQKGFGFFFFLLLWLLFLWDTEIGHWAWWKCKWRGVVSFLCQKGSWIGKAEYGLGKSK